ncbi:MAG: YciI family protein [Acidobacteriota bacterium]
MPYMLMILEQPEKRRSRSVEEGRAAYDRMQHFTEDLEARGLHKASEALKPESEGVRVEVREGRRTVLDGPFAECKEILGGFFLLDCATKEQAIAIAGECPAAEWSTVEVREVGRCWEDD